MLSIKIKKAELKLEKIIGQYAFRKLSSFIFIILSAVSLAFLIMSISKFDEFSIKEKNILFSYYIKPDLTAPGQRLFLSILFTIVATTSLITLTFSTLSLFYLITQKNNAHSLLRGITWVNVIALFSAFIILSITGGSFELRDPLVFREDYLKNYDLGKIYYSGVNFEFMWITLLFIIIQFIFSGLVRREAGFLKKTSAIQKYKLFNKNNKKG